MHTVDPKSCVLAVRAGRTQTIDATVHTSRLCARGQQPKRTGRGSRRYHGRKHGPNSAMTVHETPAVTARASSSSVGGWSPIRPPAVIGEISEEARRRPRRATRTHLLTILLTEQSDHQVIFPRGDSVRRAEGGADVDAWRNVNRLHSQKTCGQFTERWGPANGLRNQRTKPTTVDYQNRGFVSFFSKVFLWLFLGPR